MKAMENRLPVGPGSRGGMWHDPEHRRSYQRAWRAGHPEYRDRERLRRARQKARRNGQDPAGIVVPPAFPRLLPSPAVACVCGCECRERVVVLCGFCAGGMHRDDDD